ncbi:MAG: polya polymerase, partial [Anaerolineae bacterium]|nr:polya polymerase [Anaerolineae bacterium]
DAPTVLPTVRPSSIKMDLHRRDFTINTLAIRLAPHPMGELLDFYKGVEDLEKGIIRVLHSLSFTDDPTRMLRAVRFEQRFGFKIEERTEELIANALPLIERLSGDRIRHEVNLILAEKTALQGLERLQELGILQAIHPALHVDDSFRNYYAVIQQVRQSPPWPLPDDFDTWYTLTFAILTREMDEPAMEGLGRRLMVSRATREKLHMIHRGYRVLKYLKTMRPSEVTYTLEPLTQVGWLACWILAEDAATRQQIEQFVDRWRHIKPTIDGNTLLSMGVKPGPWMGKLLQDLRAAWLDGEITDIKDEHRYVQQRLRENQPEH